MLKVLKGPLSIPPADCRAYALGFSWRRCAEQVLSHLAPLAGSPGGRG